MSETTQRRPDPAAAIDRIRRALAAAGGATFRVEAAEEGGAAVALVHVYDAYDCKGTEAEVTGLLRDAPLAWRLVWH
jgi:hypothetical protein